MRLIKSFDNPNTGLRFAHFLKSKHIETQVDIGTNKDWGSDSYGTIECHVWIIQENQLPEALQLLDEYQEDPENSKFDTQVNEGKISVGDPLKRAAKPHIAIEKEGPPQLERAPGQKGKEPMGTVTFYILVLCGLLFLATQFTRPDIRELPKNIPSTPLVSSGIEKTLQYDYPYAFEIIDQIVGLYGEQSLADPRELPKEGIYLLQKFYRTPFWQGIYDPIVNRLLDKAGWERSLGAPLFEKIRQGEVWRLFTPCLLHANILHILFNMMWLMVLGQQIEAKIKSFRYILFIVIAAIVSNTAQYLVSGSNFIGFSGVICAMIVFIWARQRTAAWEGYQLERSSILFVTVFVLGMAAIQATSFFMEISGLPSLAAGIANTAHIVGGLTGYALAKIKFFSWK